MQTEAVERQEDAEKQQDSGGNHGRGTGGNWRRVTLNMWSHRFFKFYPRESYQSHGAHMGTRRFYAVPEINNPKRYNMNVNRKTMKMILTEANSLAPGVSRYPEYFEVEDIEVLGFHVNRLFMTGAITGIPYQPSGTNEPYFRIDGITEKGMNDLYTRRWALLNPVRCSLIGLSGALVGFLFKVCSLKG